MPTAKTELLSPAAAHGLAASITSYVQRKQLTLVSRIILTALAAVVGVRCFIAFADNFETRPGWALETR